MRVIPGLQTPAVVIDMDIARANILRFQRYAGGLGLKVRPHIKTHKLPFLAEMQLDAGAVGITCQKISEAHAMVTGSDRIRDVLITYNIVGADKLADLVAVSRLARISVVADSKVVIDGLSRAFASEPPLSVFVECNTGADRCGVGSPQEAADLAAYIAAADGLVFAGLMTYPPVGGAASVQDFMQNARDLIAAMGISVPVITSGGTPDMMSADQVSVVTEHRPGTYVYNDRSLVARGRCAWADCALTVVATVVSVPSQHRAIIDAGSKVLTSDLLGLTGYGHVLGRDDIAIDQLSEEHGRLVSDQPIALTVGDRVHIVPNHACVVTNMMDSVHVHHSGAGWTTYSVEARGKVL